jgi:hypothetical protein
VVISVPPGIAAGIKPPVSRFAYILMASAETALY